VQQGHAKQAMAAAQPQHQSTQPPRQWSQQQVQATQQQRVFTSIEVSSIVAGQRKAVCVPLSGSSASATPHPEAASLLQQLQQAVAGGSVSSREAAGQLVQQLQVLDTQLGVHGLHSMAAMAAPTSRPGSDRSSSPAGKRLPPPGFAAQEAARMAASSTRQYQVAGARLSQHPQQQLPNGGAYMSQSSLHTVGSASSLFSAGSSAIWTDSGLPGVDLSSVVAPTAAPSSSSVAASLGGGGHVPTSLQMLWGGSTQAASLAGTAGGDAVQSEWPRQPPGFAAGPGGNGSNQAAAGTQQPGGRAGLFNW
jgi:hypothetical protein